MGIRGGQGNEATADWLLTKVFPSGVVRIPNPRDERTLAT